MAVVKTETRAAPPQRSKSALRYLIAADSELLRAAATDRDLGHRFVAAAFPDDLPEPPMPCWRLGDGAITVVCATAPTGVAGQELPTVGDGDRLHIRVTLEAVARHYPTVDPRVIDALRAAGRKPPRGVRARVCDTDLPEWITHRLADAGLETAAITAAERSTASRRRAPMHLVEVAAAVTVTGAATFNDALRTGIGRGRAFGAGLITITDAD